MDHCDSFPITILLCVSHEFPFYLFAVTQLVGRGPVEFTRSEYVVEVEENTKVPSLVQLPVRIHPHGESRGGSR